MKTIDNQADVIDSRDIIERIEDLENELRAEYEEDEPDEKITFEKWLQLAGTDESEELILLKEVEEECGGGDWTYGIQLIRDSYFEEYCRELVEDIGDLPKDLPSYIEIDWEKTTHNLKMDYSTVDFGGMDYYYRS